MSGFLFFIQSQLQNLPHIYIDPHFNNSRTISFKYILRNTLQVFFPFRTFYFLRKHFFIIHKNHFRNPGIFSLTLQIKKKYKIIGIFDIDVIFVIYLALMAPKHHTIKSQSIELILWFHSS